MQRYPSVELDLEFSDRLVDVIGEGFDAAVRTGVLADSGLKHRRLQNYRRVMVGSPTYFARHGRPQQPADLQKHACLHYRFPSTGRLEDWPLASAADEQIVKLPQTLVCNSVEMRIHLVLNSQGIACFPDFIVARYLRDGRLQTVLDSEKESSGAMWIVWPHSRYLSPKLRVFIDCISAAMGEKA